MNNDFPRILALLRKEKKISQKQAAEELNIAQALLSHYEKGKRECGLDFLVRSADYYNVSADFLLGRSASRNGSFISEGDLEPKDPKQSDRELGSLSTALSKRLIMSGIELIFSLAGRIKNQKLMQSIISILTLAVYRVFRILHKANPKNTPGIFCFNEEMGFRLACAYTSIHEGLALDAISEQQSNIEISTSTLEREYQKQGAALLSLIKNAENDPFVSCGLNKFLKKVP